MLILLTLNEIEVPEEERVSMQRHALDVLNLTFLGCMGLTWC